MVEIAEEEGQSDIRLGKGLKLDGSSAKYEELYEGSFTKQETFSRKEASR